jgi:hypothetical protein
MGTPEQNKALVMRVIDCLYGGHVAGGLAEVERLYNELTQGDGP